MGDCVLQLYRSSAQPTMRQLGERLPAARARPGLAIVASQGTMIGTDDQRRRSANLAGAEIITLDGLGHWWMTEQNGAPGARALHEFWAHLGA